MSDIDARLREDVHLLGELLGNTIREQYGEAFLEKIEQIRKGAKADRRGAVSEKTAGDELSASLNQLQEQELLPVARAFNQFLNPFHRKKLSMTLNRKLFLCALKILHLKPS